MQICAKWIPGFKCKYVHIAFRIDCFFSYDFIWVSFSLAPLPADGFNESLCVRHLQWDRKFPEDFEFEIENEERMKTIRIPGILKSDEFQEVWSLLYAFPKISVARAYQNQH